MVGTGVCDCPIYQCIERNFATLNYDCVNVTNDGEDFPMRAGREKKTKFCIGKDDPGLGFGADYCAEKLCIDPVTKTCTSYNHTSSRRYFGRDLSTQLCISSNNPSFNAVDCATGKFCLDVSVPDHAQCLYINNLALELETTDSSFSK